jgi:hypothetical protein
VFTSYLKKTPVFLGGERYLLTREEAYVNGTDNMHVIVSTVTNLMIPYKVSFSGNKELSHVSKR